MDNSVNIKDSKIKVHVIIDIMFLKKFKKNI